MHRLDGKTALITGGTSGIGLATAKQFVNEGAYVFITGRREPELAAAVKEIGRNVSGVQGDVSNLADLDRLFGQIRKEKRKLDVVFANAGAAKYAPVGKITEEFYDSIFNINVKGLLFTGGRGTDKAIADRVVGCLSDVVDFTAGQNCDEAQFIYVTFQTFQAAVFLVLGNSAARSAVRVSMAWANSQIVGQSKNWRSVNSTAKLWRSLDTTWVARSECPFSSVKKLSLVPNSVRPRTSHQMFAISCSELVLGSTHA
jgi:NAD(P)-dependent dehydrogenase (short-subunit alcohol dehydrogenase family)